MMTPIKKKNRTAGDYQPATLQITHYRSQGCDLRSTLAISSLAISPLAISVANRHNAPLECPVSKKKALFQEQSPPGIHLDQRSQEIHKAQHTG